MKFLRISIVAILLSLFITTVADAGRGDRFVVPSPPVTYAIPTLSPYNPPPTREWLDPYGCGNPPCATPLPIPPKRAYSVTPVCAGGLCATPKPLPPRRP